MGKYLKPVIFILLFAIGCAYVAKDATATAADTTVSGSEIASTAATMSYSEKVSLLARVIYAEAEAEPYIGKVAVAAVLLNRVDSPSFPNTMAGVIYQKNAFESVSNGRIWAITPNAQSTQAAQAALNGWDPTYGSLYFWNPVTATSKWVWSRTITVQYGKHVFAR